MKNKTSKIAADVLDGRLINTDQANILLEEGKADFEELLYWSDKIRQKFFSNKIRVCSIVPGRLGGCDQDCAFCAQSVRYDTPIDKKPSVLTDDQIIAAAKEAHDAGVPNLGIVYSGKAITNAEFDRLLGLIEKIHAEYKIGFCASLGIISPAQAKRLASVGVVRYNHNLETSENHFANIVTTHKYADRVNTIKTCLDAGLGVCGGGIFGIGETDSDRIDMAFALRDLGVDMVPMNFLHPIPGTPLGDTKPMSPRQILTIVALYRFILPQTDLKVAGGRALNLRDMQSWIFRAGATAILTGNYLTTAGRSADQDMQMLKDLNLEIRK